MPKKFAIKPRGGFGGQRGAAGKKKSDDTSGQGGNQEIKTNSVSSYHDQESSQCVSIQDGIQFGKAPLVDGSTGTFSLKKAKSVKKTLKKSENVSIILQNQNYKIKEMREKTMLRDNWNYFVNDDESKTDTILRFKKPHTKTLYEKHLIASSAYSLRIILGLATLSYIYLLDISECPKNYWRFFCYTNYPSRILAIMLSFFCTFPNFGQFYISSGLAKWISTYHASIISINAISYFLSQELVNYYKSFYMQKLELKSSLSSVNSDTDSLLKSSLQSQEFQIEVILWVIVLIQNLPVLGINLSVVTDWVEYVTACYIIFVLHCVSLGLINTQGHTGFHREYLYKYSIVLAFTVVVFASFEKVRKELFIINHTNSKTKKQIMKFFSQSPPCLIMEKDGTIKLCNETFEDFIHNILRIRNMPKDFYKFIQADEKASEKFNNIMKLKQSKQTDYEEPEFEIIFDKLLLKEANDPEEKKEGEAPSEQITEQFNDIQDLESQSSIRQYDAPKEPNSNFHDQFVAFKIVITPVNYKSRMCFMLNFENISEQKSKMRLFALHARLLGKFQFNNQKRMEHLHKQLVDNNQEEIAEMVGEFLGNSQVTLNMIQQINHHFNYLSNLQPNKIENYVLSEEIDFCIDGLTANLTRFRICMRSMLDFGIKYSKDNQMQVKSEFKAYTPNKHFVIQFSVILTQNEKVELDLLEQLLTEQNEEEKKYEDLTFDKLITNRYDGLYKHIKEFGYGMLIFPSVVKQLNGHYFIQKDNISMDQGSSTANVSNIALDKVKIGFRVPFEQAGMDSIVATHSYKINFAKKEVIDGRVQVYKTPQIKSKGRGFINKAAASKMKDLMMNQGLSQISKQSADLPQLNNIPGMEVGGSNSVLEPEHNGELNYFSRIQVQERQNNPAVQEYMSVKIFKNTIKQSGASNEASDAENKSQKSKKGGENSQSQKQDENEESKHEEQKIEQSDVQNNTEGNSGKNLTSGFPNDNKSGGGKQQEQQIQPREGGRSNQTKLNIKSGRKKDQLLQFVKDLGKPQEYFGADQNGGQIRSSQENGEADSKNQGGEYRGVSTANFIPGNGKVVVNNQEKDSGSSVSQSQQFINADSNGIIPINSFQEKQGNQKPESVGNSEIKNQFSFMETGNKDKKKTRNNLSDISLNENDNTKKFDSMNQNQIPINQIPIERKNDIRESHDEVIDGQPLQKSNPGIMIPQSANGSSLPPDLQPLRKQSIDPHADDNNSEDKDMVKSLISQRNNRDLNHLNRSLRSQSDLSYNFQMEKIDSFMMSSEQSKQLSQNENVQGINNQKRTMTLSKKLYREESRPLYETTLIATRGLMNPQEQGEEIDDSQQIDDSNGGQIVDGHDPENEEPAPSASQEQIEAEEEKKDENNESIPKFNSKSSQKDVSIQSNKEKISKKSEKPVSEEIQQEPIVAKDQSVQSGRRNIEAEQEVVQGSALEEIIRPIEQEPEEQKQSRQHIFMEAYTDYSSDDPKHQAIGNYSSKENLNQIIGFEQYQKSNDQQKNTCHDLDMIKVATKYQANLLQEKNPHRNQEIMEWQRNISMHPQELNRHYDVMDRSGQLRNLNIIIEQQDELDKLWENRNNNPNQDQPSYHLSPHDKEKSRTQNVPGNSGLIRPGGNTRIVPECNIDGESRSPHSQQPGIKDDPDHKFMVLVAEDNEAIQMAMKMMLDGNNVDYELCQNGNEATEKFEEYLEQKKMFDIILMDLYMPHKDGFQASNDIRKLELKYGISKKDRHFICAVSSEVNLAIERKCFDNGMDDVVAKPLPLNILLTLLNDHNRRKFHSSQLNSQQPGTSSNRQNVSPIQESRHSPALGTIQGEDQSENLPGYSTAQNPKIDNDKI